MLTMSISNGAVVLFYFFQERTQNREDKEEKKKIEFIRITWSSYRRTYFKIKMLFTMAKKKAFGGIANFVRG